MACPRARARLVSSVCESKDYHQPAIVYFFSIKQRSELMSWCINEHEHYGLVLKPCLKLFYRGATISLLYPE